jgi:pyroglutamyl-peptidase
LKSRLLVTGFGPFPGVAINPSGKVAALVADSPRLRRLGIEAQALVLPTAYTALEGVLAPALAHGFDAVLMIGVAGRAREIRVERRALNRASLLAPDAAGQRRTSLMLGPGPAHRLSAVAPSPVLDRLRRHRLPCRPSRDAGRYLCNASYFAALAEPVPVLFLHIPKPPLKRPLKRSEGRPARPARAGWHERLAAAFADVGIDLLAAARRRHPRPSRAVRPGLGSEPEGSLTPRS